MAVEIPVIIDIEKAFQDAANRVATAIKPLENKIDSYTSKMQLKVGVDDEGKQKLKSVSELLNVIEKKQGAVTRKSISSLSEMSTALADAENKLMRLYAIEDAGYSLSKKQQKDKEALEKTVVAITAVIEQRKHGIELLEREAQEQIRAKRAEEERLNVMSKTATTMAELSAKMSAIQGQINNVQPFSQEWYKLLPLLGQVRNEIASVQNMMQRFSTSANSLDNYNARLQEIIRSFNAMSERDRTAVGGGASAKLKQMQTQYADVKQAIDDVSKSLSAEYEARKKAADQQERLNKRVKESIQQRRYEDAVLKMSGSSIRVLQEQQRILTERLSRTKLGTDEFKRLKEQLAAVNAELNKATGGVTTMTNAMKKQSVVLGNLKSIASMYISVFGALRFVKQIRDVTGELEFQRISLGRLIQDMERGNYLFERIKEQAVESPFRIKDLVTYTKQLAAYRIEQEELFGTTKRLADISAGLGVDMNRLILAYGQVRAASVLRGQELRQFTEAGIPLVELLAEKFTDLNGELVTTGEVFKKISERAVPFSMISDIFEDLTEKGGMFYEMQEEQAKTLKGRWEKLKDAFDIALQSVGDTDTFQRQNDILIGTLRFIADHIRVLTKIVDAASWAWAAYNAALLLTGTRTKAVVTAEQQAVITETLRTKKLSALFVNTKAQAWAERELAAAATQAAAGTNFLARALGKLKIAFLTNPYAMVGALILGVALSLGRYKKAADDATSSTETLNRAVDDMRAFNKKHDRIEKLIHQYDELSHLESRTSAQNETLARTTKKLSDEFPQLSDALNKDNLSMKDRLKIVQDLNAEEEKRLEQMREEKQKDLEASKTKLSYAETEQETKEAARKQARDYYLELQAQLKTLEGEGKKGRGAFAKFLFGDNEYDEIYRQLARQRTILDEAEKSANEAGEKVNSLKKGVESLKEELEGYKGNAKEAEETWEEWQKQIYELQKAKLKFGESPLFSKGDISSFDSVYDLSKKLKSKIEELTASLAGMRAMFESMAEGPAKKSLGDTIKTNEKYLEIANAIKEAFNFNWKSSGGKDSRLSDLKKQISEITNAYKKFLELRKYMSQDKSLDEIGKLFPQLKGWEPTFENMLNRLTEMRNNVANKLKASPKDKTLLDMQLALDTEISNLRFDDLKKKTEDELKRVSNEIKRSEAARDFYNNILGITGDEQLSASITMSVYGGVGEEFKERLQRELFAALKGAPIGKTFTQEMKDEFSAAITTLDLGYFREHLNELPETVRETFSKALDEAEKYDAKWLEEIYRTYEKTKSYEERITDIRKREADFRKRVMERNLPLSEKEKLAASSQAREQREVADVQVEALKNTYEWEKAFEDLDRVGNKTLSSLRDKLRALIEAQKDALDPAQYKALVKELEKVDSTISKRNPIEAIYSGGKRQLLISSALNAQNRIPKKGTEAYDKAIEKIKEFNENVGEADKIDLDHLEDELMNANKTMELGIEGVKDYVDAWKSAVDAITDAFDLKDVPILGETMEGISDSLSFIAGILPVIITLNSVLNGTLNMNPFIAIGTGIVATIGAIVGLIKGIVNAKVERLNKKIEEQDKLIKDLEYQYGRLEKAIEKSFGSDYITNYNQQLENLAAQQEAYLKQAEAERNKGKKADEDKIKEYENSARDTADKILDMQSQLSEFFSGTDITSAAKDFADSWIEAYKEFGSTTIAMREKFQEMVEEMVQKSLAAKVMQQLLTPIFEEIDRLAQEGGELSVADIAAIAKMADEQIPNINEAMLTLMNTLTQAGYNLRQQPGQFTGISRNIANATEESITGLAAGINTQNYYMSYMPTISANVAAILTYITGGYVQTTGATPITPTDNELMMSYFATIPTINENLVELIAVVKSVVTPKNLATNTNVVAVRN